MDIQVILEASAIATIVGAGISYFTFRKSSKLTYITQERKEWRSEIRKIAEEFEVCPYFERQNILAKLKTRINAYGKTDLSGSWNYQADSHIWEKIEQIEKCNSEKEYKKLREQLIYYLSLLLKNDWERSKNEVNGEPGQILAWGLFALMFVFLGIGLVESILKDSKLSVELLLTNIRPFVPSLIIFLIMFLGLYFIGQGQKIYVYDLKFLDIIVQNIMWVILVIWGICLMVLKLNEFVSIAGFIAILSGTTKISLEFDQYLKMRTYKDIAKKAKEEFEKENQTTKGRKYDS